MQGEGANAVLGRDPHEVFLAGICIPTGLAILVTGLEPASLEASMPPFLVPIWTLGLLLGGLLVVGSAVWRDRWTGLLIERVGLYMLTLAAIAYTAGVISAGGFNATYVAALNAAFAAANVARWRQITRYFRGVKAYRDHQQEVTGG